MYWHEMVNVLFLEYSINIVELLQNIMVFEKKINPCLISMNLMQHHAQVQVQVIGSWVWVKSQVKDKSRTCYLEEGIHSLTSVGNLGMSPSHANCCRKWICQQVLTSPLVLTHLLDVFLLRPCYSHCFLPSHSALSLLLLHICGSHGRVSALFKAGGSSFFMACCEKAQIRMLCFHSPSF